MTTLEPFPQPQWTEVTYTDAKGVSHTLPSDKAIESLRKSCTLKHPRYSWNDSQERAEESHKADIRNYEASVRDWFKELGITFTDSSTYDWERPWLQVDTPGGIFNVEDLVAP